MPSTLKAVFFDAGHTLIHTHPSVGEIYAREAEALGVSADADLLGREFSIVFAENEGALAAGSIGAPASDAQDYEMWRGIVRKVHTRVPALAELDAEAWFRRLYEAFGRADHWKLYPDVEATLRGLRARGLVLGVISNWSTRLRSIARDTGLDRLVDFMVVSSEVGIRKPDARIFRLALERAAVGPHEAMHAGDLVEDDFRGAERAGIAPALVWRKPVPPAGVEQTRVVRDLTGLLGLI
jgi:putative hydrolase of the HAD superfamily